MNVKHLTAVLKALGIECRRLVDAALAPIAKRIDEIESRPLSPTQEQMSLAIVVAVREVREQITTKDLDAMLKRVDEHCAGIVGQVGDLVQRAVDDVIAKAIPQMIETAVAAAVKAIEIPAGPQGDPGVAPTVDEILRAGAPQFGEAIARQVTEALPDERVAEIVSAAVQRSTEALRASLPDLIPAPVAGPPGPAPTDEQVARAAAAYLELHAPEPGEPGPAPTAEDIGVAVRAYFEANPIEDGADGKDATEAQIAKAVADYLAAHPVEDGAPGQDASDEQVERILAGYLQRHPVVGQKGDTGPAPDVDVIEAVVTKHSARWQLEFERIARDFLQASVDKFPRPKDGRDAVPVDGFDAKVEGRLLTLTLTPADPDLAPIVRTIKLQTIEYLGVWKEGEYDVNDVVTWAGSAFIANRPTKAKPETDDSWRLFVKRGRDGKDLQPPKASGPVRI